MPPNMIVEHNVKMPMRDGTHLLADIYRPADSAPCPAILVRLPYNKEDLLMQLEAIPPLRAVDAGYAIVFQDTRGRYQSEGDFYPFIYEADDGYDSVEWVAEQSWAAGAVGMAGASYFGATQWLAAIQNPPHLKAIFPLVTSSEYYEGWTYQGGAFQLGFLLLWVMEGLAPDTVQRTVDAEAARVLLEEVDKIAEHYQHLPLEKLPVLRSQPGASYFFDWLSHHTRDSYWDTIAVNRHYDRIKVPALNAGGWYDLFLKGTLENYVRMKQEGGSEAARQGQRLVIGPWSHGKLTGDYPDTSYGVFSSLNSLDLHGLALQFFDHHLKDTQKELAEKSPVKLFVMGENQWHDEEDWPLPGTEYQSWYLHSSGQAGRKAGLLSRQKPADEPVDVYLHHPLDPVPSAGGPTFLPGMRLGAAAGPHDQRSIEARPDVLTYRSKPLTEALRVIGPLTCHLWASTSATDTDWVVRLCDVLPDGTSQLLAEGILRASSREGLDRRVPVPPDEPIRYEIDLVATANVFAPGHRIGLDIASSSWPRFDVNAGTGHSPGVDGPEDQRPALQRVFHDTMRPTHIILPVIAP